MKDKKIELTFSKNTILENAALESFTNDFIYHDDNYFQKNIGSLFGVIQVLDNSEQSEYIPNLLTNLIKKEFYSQSKRSTEESFEASLKKANLALADLAEHDILKWNNNLHSIVGVFKDQTLYFTQVGSAMIFLGRDNKIINLSEPNSSTNIHPVKTFRDVVAGEIKAGDKIIISTPTIQNIFKLNDLSRLFDTFNSKEFDNLFLKTIKKEGRNISVIIINIKKKKEKVVKPESVPTINELTKNKNFLGGEIKKVKNNKKKKSSNNKVNKILEKKEKIEKSNSSKSKNATRAENPPLTKVAKAKFPKKKEGPKKSSTIKKGKNSSKTKKKKLASTSSKKNLGTKTFSKNNSSIKKLNDLRPIKKKALPEEISPFEKTPEIYINSADNNLQKNSKNIPSKKLKKYFSPEKKQKIEKVQKKPSEKKTFSEIIPSITNGETNKQYPLIIKGKDVFNKSKNILKGFLQKILLSSKKLTLPKNLSSLKKNNLFKKENLQNINPEYFLILVKKYYRIILLILFIILTPLIISRLYSNKKNLPEKQPIPLTKNIPLHNNSLIENKNPTKTLATLETKLNLISESDTIILASGNSTKLYEIQKNDNTKKEIKIPEKINLSDLKTITYMPSLNLFFLSSNSKVISYSPATKKFYPNKIIIPSNFSLLDQGTYLDYLYLLDKNSKQLYRYPRDAGGFGSKKNWLKTPLKNTDKISSLAIDDHIRLAYFDGTVEKYFKNKLIDTKKFNIKNLKDIYTKDSLKNYYLLDQTSGTIFQVNKENDRVMNKYQNEALTKTNNFSVDEKNKKIHLLNDNSIMVIDL